MRGYSAEAYRDLYDQSIGEMEYQEAMRSRGVKIYRNRSTKAGDVLDLSICAVWAARHEAARAKAAKKRKQSPEVIEKRNDRETERKIAGLVNENFKAGDYGLYLSFAEKEQDPRKALRWYFDRCKREHKKQGKEFRYLYILESSDGEGNPVRPHIHIFVDGDLPRDWYEDLWRSRYGIANATRLRPDENGLSGFAHYIQKAPRKTKKVRRWACSQNLKKPEERRSTRLPDGKRLTKKLVHDMVSGRRDPKATLEAAYPGYRLLRFEARTSEHVTGIYLEIRMTKFGGGKNGESRRRCIG